MKRFEQQGVVALDSLRSIAVALDAVDGFLMLFPQVLIKGRASRDPVGMVEAEAAYADLDRAARITMADTEVIRTMTGEPFFFTDRFDRAEASRLHMQTASALLDVDFRAAPMDYAELLKLVQVTTRDPRAVEQMFRRMVFNARSWNRDDHLKNHSFLMAQGGEWQLAPAYDLTFSAGPGGEHSLLIGGEGRQPGRAGFVNVAERSGLKPARALDILDEVDAAIGRWTEFSEIAKVTDGLRRQIEGSLSTAAGWS